MPGLEERRVGSGGGGPAIGSHCNASSSDETLMEVTNKVTNVSDHPAAVMLMLQDCLTLFARRP